MKRNVALDPQSHRQEANGETAGLHAEASFGGRGRMSQRVAAVAQKAEPRARVTPEKLQDRVKELSHQENPSWISEWEWGGSLLPSFQMGLSGAAPVCLAHTDCCVCL